MAAGVHSHGANSRNLTVFLIQDKFQSDIAGAVAEFSDCVPYLLFLIGQPSRLMRVVQLPPPDGAQAKTTREITHTPFYKYATLFVLATGLDRIQYNKTYALNDSSDPRLLATFVDR